jgi:hypothetical protein
MKKYRSPWGMSTTNHNILCLHYIPGTLLLNTAIRLWKTEKPPRKSQVRRSKNAPDPVQISMPEKRFLP